MRCFFSIRTESSSEAFTPPFFTSSFWSVIKAASFAPLLLFQERDAVNIKLSDYGISRQSFHEGVLGVEGTPGYQAPEVRPGIVYDEKVETALMSRFFCLPPHIFLRSESVGGFLRSR